MEEKKSRSFYIKWLSVFVLFWVAMIAVGVWTTQRDAQREAERKYEFNIIQSIIENLALYQDEIESWGYQVSVLTLEEEPENEALQRYDRHHCQPVLVLTDADGGMYCFYYGFDQYASTVSYPAEIKRTSGAYEEAVKTVRLELYKREIYQAPYWENTNDAGKYGYYDVTAAIYVTAFSIEAGKEVWAESDSGFYHTNYCSNNFVDCMFVAQIDPETKNAMHDRHIKREYSAEQLLAFYQQGLALQEWLIELYQGTAIE